MMPRWLCILAGIALVLVILTLLGVGVHINTR